MLVHVPAAPKHLAFWTWEKADGGCWLVFDTGLFCYPGCRRPEDIGQRYWNIPHIKSLVSAVGHLGSAEEDQVVDVGQAGLGVVFPG